MSQAHRDYFNALASEWSERMRYEPRFSELLQHFGVSRGDRVLDAGTGTGRMTHPLTEMVGSEGVVVAQDFAFDMVLQGCQNDGHGDIHWVCDDLSEMGYRSGTFDKVLCFSVFPHLQDPLAVLKEVYRVLKPGGRVLILHTASSSQLNAFHASLNGIVKSDRLLSLDEMQQCFLHARLEPVLMIDQENLYWAEGLKEAA